MKKCFKAGYFALPGKKRKEVRAKLMERCYWTNKNASFKGLNVFYRKMKGESRISPLEVPIIEEVFKEYGIDAWTGFEIISDGVEDPEIDL